MRNPRDLIGRAMLAADVDARLQLSVYRAATTPPGIVTVLVD